MRKFKSIQLLRAFACVYVMLGHLIFYFGLLFPNTRLASLFHFGYSGVDMFFVISGFVIYTSTQQLEEGFLSFIKYLKKRLIRIFPIYWIILLFFLVFIGTTEPISFKNLLPVFLLLPHHEPVFDVTWSLSFELYFYVLYGLGLIKKQLMVIPIIVFSMAVLYFVLSFCTKIKIENLPLQSLAGYHVIEFFMGVLAGIFFKKIPMYMAYFFIIAGILAFFSRNTIANPLFNFSFPSMLLIAGLAKIESDKIFYIPSIILLLGDASYVIYLIHNPLLRDTILYHLKESSNLTKFNFSLLIALTLAAGVFIHSYIETPVMQYLNKKIKL